VTHFHEAYGLSIRSNRPLPGLRPSDARRIDLEVEFDERHAPEVDDRAGESTPLTGWGSVRECPDGGCQLLYASHGGARAWSMCVSGDGRSIGVRWRGAVDLADIASFVEATGIPTALTLRGVPLLHGCAVDTGAAAFVVIGPGGAGKSTVAAAAVAGGRSLLADDVVALDGTGDVVHVHPAGSQLRMHEDTARAMGWDPEGLPRVFVTPTMSGKRFARLSSADGSLCATPRRLDAIFVLGRRSAPAPSIARLPPTSALPALLANTFGDRAVDRRVRARLLPFWARLAQEVPAHAVHPPNDLAAVPAFVDALAAASG
jgi:hypothetical protein